MNLLKLDQSRYADNDMPAFQKYFRLVQQTRFVPLKYFYKMLFYLTKHRNHIELSSDTQIGGGCYFGHPYCITINPNVKIGSNVNIHKGVTLGKENRGFRKGSPTISDDVWIGINATVVGNIVIGKDVLIAPNTYVNCDIPDHSVVFGNPCIIKHKENATKDYVNRKCVMK